MRRAIWAIALLIPLAVGADPSAAPRTIAVGRLGTSPSLAPLRERARRIFEPQIEDRLRSAGYRVVSVEETDAVWLRLRDSLGGFYDTYTGRIVPEKFRIVRDGTLRALVQRHGIDAWLQPGLSTFRLPFSGGRAEWHGTGEETGGRGGLSGLLIGRSTGTLNAVSLVLTLEDASSGEILHRGAGGVQLATRIVGGDLQAAPADSLLRDGARNAAATGIAVDSLVAHWPPR